MSNNPYDCPICGMHHADPCPASGAAQPARERLRNIELMCLDVEEGNWPAEAAIKEIAKVAALPQSVGSLEQKEGEKCPFCGMENGEHAPNFCPAFGVGPEPVEVNTPK